MEGISRDIGTSHHRLSKSDIRHLGVKSGFVRKVAEIFQVAKERLARLVYHGHGHGRCQLRAIFRRKGNNVRILQFGTLELS